MKYFLLGLVFLSFQTAQAFDAEVFRFQRCYAQFTRTKISSDNAVLQKVKNKELTGTQACMGLLQESMLGEDGRLKVKTPESREILRTFQSFHHSWFPSYDLNVLTGDFADGDFYDINEMGYEVTYSLFKKGVNYSNIVTDKNSLKAIREAPAQPIYFFDNSLGNPKKRTMAWLSGDPKDPKWHPNNFKSFGELVGLEVNDNKDTFINLTYQDKQYPVNADKTLGAGILGSVPYLLLNSGQIRSKMDGQLLEHRRWSKAVMSDLFCRSLPVLTEADVTAMVDKSSTIPFRQSSKCMMCHATMDNMASVLRNVELFHTSDNNDFATLRGVFINKVDSSSKNYYEQEPQGEVIYRNYKNELVDNKVSSLQDLGRWVTTQDDFYICAAKRYTSFLTGDNADNMKDFVVEEGLKLKKHQSLAQLIEDIVSSQYYLNRKL